MRSRPKMTVLLRPGNPLPGRPFEAEVHLVSEDETPLDRVTFDLVGTESVTIQQGKTTHAWRDSLVRLRAEVAGRPLTRGEHVYRAVFELPQALPPAFRGRYARIEYTLEVRCDIPWWLDRFERYDVPVPLSPSPVARSAGVFVTREAGPRTGETYAELSLASTTFEPGDIVDGTIALQNARRETEMRVSLVASERLFPVADFWHGGSYSGTFESLRWSYAFNKGAPEDGHAYPFRFQIAADTIPSFTGRMSGLEWAIEVVSEGIFSRKVLLRAPIAIVPRKSTAAKAPSRVPAVGDQRRFESFQRVAARLGLAFDPERGELGATTSGVTVRVAAESRPDGGLVTVARLQWPPLGMGLHVERASWTDAISLREIEVGHTEFDERYHVRSRFPEQARAFFDAALCALLLTCDHARIDDAGAELAVPLMLIDEKPLLEFATAAMQAARLFSAAFERVPVPRGFEGRAAAWIAFSSRVSGRFEPGSVAIREALLGQERLEIATDWTEDGAFRTTRILVHLSTRVDPQAISPGAESQRKALEEAASARCEITETTLSLTLSRPIPDPEELEPFLDALTRLVQLVKGRGTAGPFRS